MCSIEPTKNHTQIQYALSPPVPYTPMDHSINVNCFNGSLLSFPWNRMCTLYFLTLFIFLHLVKVSYIYLCLSFHNIYTNSPLPSPPPFFNPHPPLIPKGKHIEFHLNFLHIWREGEGQPTPLSSISINFKYNSIFWILCNFTFWDSNFYHVAQIKTQKLSSHLWNKTNPVFYERNIFLRNKISVIVWRGFGEGLKEIVGGEGGFVNDGSG